MRTLQIAMYALLALAPIAGCGDVSDAGAVDANGCPVLASEWTGTATLMGGCAGAPATLQITGGTYGSSQPGMPTISFVGVEPSDNMCIAIVGADVPCGRASYTLKMPVK